GTSAYVRVPDAASLDIGSTGTIEAWVRLDALGRWHGVVSKGTANSPSAHNYALEVTNGNRAECGIGNGGSANTVRSPTSLTAATFYHLACVWTGTQLQLFVNGVVNASVGQIVTPAGNNAPLSVGQYGVSSDRLRGTVDEVRVYRRALTQAEVQSDMNTAIAPPAADVTNPTVALTAPSPGATVSGQVAVSANASDNVGVVGVQFKLDGANLGAEDTSAPYTLQWDTLPATNGTHVLSASARDPAGNTGSASGVSVTVDNEKPTVPANVNAAAVSSSQIDVSWSASSDNAAVTGYRVRRNGTLISTTTATSFSNTGLAPQTTHSYTVSAFDAAGNSSAESAAASATTQSPPPATGLVAAYRFGEGTGTVTADSTPNGNGGTLVNGAAWAFGGGKYGNAINFDGTNDHVRVADSFSLDSGLTGTTEAWVKVDRLGRWHGVLAKGSANNNQTHNYALELNNANRWVCILGSGVTAIVLGSTSAPVTNRFYHVACTWDATTVRLYIDGALNASVAQSFIPAANSSPLYVGQFGGNADRLDGIIDEIRIYSRALAQAEIQSDMNTPL
ncbi:MAG: LamG-like jellyroll fold domain-containing protein, partial [Gaiellaceae bacterium]